MTAAVGLTLGPACSAAPDQDPPAAVPAVVGAEAIDGPPPGPSWAPDGRRLGGLDAVAEVDGDRYLLHTAHGDVGFLPGINLGATTPGHLPGQLAISAEDVRRWLPLMGRFGFRAVRVYTILPPHFYAELAAYNRRNADAPLYLVQGVYLPDESYVESGDLYDEGVTSAFRDELGDAVAAVHGDLSRGATPGRASGEWTADVTPWLAGWIVGAELDPLAVAASDARNADAPASRGRYFRSAEGATPTERWLAARLDDLAAADAERGHTAPVAFVNWPTLDPLVHPEEPNEREDLVGVDANAVRPTDAWPGGTFASYHAYPYYPDFQALEPGLRVRRGDDVDPYFGYLQALQRHHAGMPVMVTEFGVPSSIGSAHAGSLGRDQGGHAEQEAMAMDADMLRSLHELDLAGGLLFAWTDEWFKATWNTAPRHVPADRRQLWHDPLTNEQHFGVLATDAVGGDDARLRAIAETPEVTVRTGTDESWVHLTLELAEPPSGPVTLAFDVVPGGADRLPGPGGPAGGADHAVVVDAAAGTAQAWVRTALDLVPLDGLPPPDPRPAPVDGWVPQQLTLDRAWVVPSTGEQLPAEFFDVGNLHAGVMDPAEPGYDSRSTWRLDGGTLTLRLPWGLVGVGDPSSRQALVPDQDLVAATTPVERIGLTVHVDGRAVETSGIAWEPWQHARHQERVKAGAEAYADALADVS